MKISIKMILAPITIRIYHNKKDRSKEITVEIHRKEVLKVEIKIIKVLTLS
jgi:hypothetical protein